MDASQKMQLFQNLSLVFAAIAIIGLSLSIFFFFFFNIRDVYALKFGKAKRQTIERMAANNSKTGRLQAVSGLTRDKTVSVVQNPALPITEEIHPGDQGSPSAGIQANETAGLGTTPDTTVLGGTAGTTILNTPDSGAGETVVLTAQSPVAASGVPAEVSIRFEITESTMVIHTKEIL